MKKLILLFILVTGFASAQIMVTPDGHPRFPKKGVADTIVATDTILISKVKGEVFGIAYPDFIDGLPGIDWSTPVDADIIPDTDQAYDIGTALKKIGSIYATSFEGGAFIGSNLEVGSGLIGTYLGWTDNPSFDPSGHASNRGYIFWDDTAARFKYGVGGTATTGTFALSSDLASKANLSGGNTFSGIQNHSGTNHFNANATINSLFLGGQQGTLERRWWLNTETTDDLKFSLQTTDQTDYTAGSFALPYKLNASGTPTDATDLTPKSYVDAATSGGNSFIKKNIRIATTANITLSGLQTIDGNSTADGERILVKNQTAPAENGIYIASSGSWARSTEANTSTKLARTYIYVTSGSTNYNKFFLTDFDEADTLGSTSIVFTETPFDLGGTTNAVDITITDAGNYFTATDVEEALQELGQANENTTVGETVLNASRSAISSDRFGIITNSTASDYTYTINTGVFDVGEMLYFENFSTGNIEIAYGASVTGDVAETVNINSSLVLWQRTANNWIIYSGEAVLTTAEKAALPASLQSNARYKFYLTD